ncbi:hypothetical protein N7540_009822 [Penicillium herquei]|nr:hypothetical protein N7540_009822 [Penicillium herquei]
MSELPSWGPSWGLGMLHYLPPADAATQHAAQMARFHGASLDGLIGMNAIANGISKPHTNGVIKIESVFPLQFSISMISYTITRQELQQSIPRRYTLADNFPIHVTMERSTGKTMDCYIELASPELAVEAVRVASEGGFPRIGSRHVEITLSNQGELMKAIFPLAKCVAWSSNGQPIVRQRYPDEMYSTGFTGFISQEELRSLVAYAEFPKRNNFTNKVYQRTFESLLSAVSKYPWQATKLYTVDERNQLFQTIRFMLEFLVWKIKRNAAHSEQMMGLDWALVSDMLNVALLCPGFNPRMKYCLVELSELYNPGIPLRQLSAETLAYFPFDTLTWTTPYDPCASEFFGGFVGDGKLPSTKETSEVGFINRWTYDRLLEPYGRQWYEWDVTMMTPGWTYERCIQHEENLLNRLMRSAYERCRQQYPPHEGPSAIAKEKPLHFPIDSAQNPKARIPVFTENPDTPGEE